MLALTPCRAHTLNRVIRLDLGAASRVDESEEVPILHTSSAPAASGTSSTTAAAMRSHQ
jgi:hypothetical protein